jgi:chorismate mutase
MKTITLFAFATLLSISAFAQPDDLRGKKEKMDAMKAGFITRELDLSPQEAQQFWPVYNELDKKIEDLRIGLAEKFIALKKEGKTLDDLADAELIALMNERLSNDEKIAKLKREYHDKFLKVLGIKKTAKLYVAEMEFARDLMRQSRHHNPGGNPRQE